METIIAAVITGIVTLGASYCMYLGKIQKLLSKADELSKAHDHINAEHKDRRKEHENLTNGHANLSKEHKDLSDEHKRLLSDSRLIIQKAEETGKIVADMSVAAKEEKIAQQFRYEHLSEKQKVITENVSDSIKAFEALKNELLAVNAENKDLHSRIDLINSQYHDLQITNKNLVQDNTNLQKELKELIAENKAAVTKYDDLILKINSPQQPPKPTHEFDNGWDMER